MTVKQLARRDTQIAKLAGEMQARGKKIACRDLRGAGVHDWRILATDGHAAVLVRREPLLGAPDMSRIMPYDTRTTSIVALSDYFKPTLTRIATCASERSHAIALHLEESNRLWFYAEDHDSDVCAREWIPVGWSCQSFHAQPMAVDARLLREALKVAGHDGYLHLQAAINTPWLFESGDGKYGYLLMPMQCNHDRKTLAALNARIGSHYEREAA